MNCHATRPDAARRPAGGFTLLELVVVMGILAGFLVMLVQLVDAGLRLFRDGEIGQTLADRTSRAERLIADELRALRGGASGRDRNTVDDRLLVQRLPIGLPPRPERGATLVQVLRGAVRLSPDRELALIEAKLATDVVEQNGELPPAEVEAQVALLRATEPLRGIGNLLLLPWRQENADDALLELRAGWFLPGQKVPHGGRFIDPFEVLLPGSPQLPAVLVDKITVPILDDLLHVEFAFWSQRTQAWDSNRTGASGGAGPEQIWDSARGGWLTDEAMGGVWAFDRGGPSLGDATDDIHPHAIHVQCVVAQPRDLAPEGLLSDGVTPDDQSLSLLDGDRFPGSLEGGWVKVRGEWMHYAARSGDRLTGLRRGQRGTKAIEHPSGVRVHVGRTIEFVVPLPHAKDDWNG